MTQSVIPEACKSSRMAEDSLRMPVTTCHLCQRAVFQCACALRDTIGDPLQASSFSARHEMTQQEAPRAQEMAAQKAPKALHEMSPQHAPLTVARSLGTQYLHLFKVLLLGDSSVGKSSLLLRFVDGLFSDSLLSSIGSSYARPRPPSP